MTHSFVVLSPSLLRRNGATVSQEPSMSNVSVPRPRWPARVFCLAEASSDGTLQPAVSTMFSSSPHRTMTDSESESLSPPRDEPGHFDSPPTKRAKLDHWIRHSVATSVVRAHTMATEEEIATAVPATHLQLPSEEDVATAVPLMHRQPSVDLTRHAAPEPHVELEGSIDKGFKYGECPRCGCALHPAVPFSGAHKGAYILRCNNFDRFENGNRRCWYCTGFQGDPKTLPRGICQRRTRMLQDLSFHFR